MCFYYNNVKYNKKKKIFYNTFYKYNVYKYIKFKISKYLIQNVRICLLKFNK